MLTDLITDGSNSTGSHVGAAHSLDLLHGGKLLVIQDLVKVNDDLVEKPDALNPLVDVLRVELSEVRDAGKKDPGIVPLLGEEILHTSLGLEVELRHVEREEVLDQLVGVPPHLGHVLQLLVGLLLPEEVQAAGDLHLTTVIEDVEREEDQVENTNNNLNYLSGNFSACKNSLKRSSIYILKSDQTSRV